MAATSEAGTRRLKTRCSSSSRPALPKGTWMTPGRSGPKPAWYLALEAVRLTAPYVRPWKAPRKATTYWRRVWKRASLRAASTASAPELPRKTRVGPLMGAMRAISAAAWA